MNQPIIVMSSNQTSQQLIEQIEVLFFQKNNNTAFKKIIDELKLEVQNEQNKLKTLLENIDEGFAQCEIICDADGVPIDYKFLCANKAFEKQTGLSTSQVLGKTLLEIFPDSEKRWIEFYGNVALTQKFASTKLYSRNTKRHFVSSAYSFTKGEFSMLFKDITASTKLAAARLEITKGKEQNSAVLANMQEAFVHCEIICDNKGIMIDYRFLEVNMSFESQTGLKSENVIGKTILELFPDIEKSWISIFGQVALSQKPTSFVKFNHNTNKYYQANAFSPAKGEFAVFLRDITDQEIKRIALEKAYLKAEENDKLKSAFLANMSHEVRTPMNAIMGFSDLLEEDNISEEDKKVCLKQIKSSGIQLLTIISDIVDISKIDANQQRLSLVAFDLNLFFDELLNQYSVLNRNTKLSLKIDKGQKDGPFMFLTDESKLKQILSNLIENAIKFTEKGEVIFGYAIKDEHVQFYVKDSGIGIKKQDYNLVFKRFGQIKNISRKVVSGTGLGIPIAKGLVELFKGEIWFESKLNKGTTFYFTIPYLKKPESKVSKAHKFTILIAEDDDVNFLLLNLWLNSHFNVIRAVNGFEAVALFQKNDAIDIIIMDIRMPYMDGIEATKEIRKTDMHIPIIAHTAYAMNEESILIKKAGCNQVLIKPITRDTLLNVLTKYKVVI